MKKRILAVGLVLSLALTSCASMLDHAYLSVAPHNKTPAAEADSSAIRVETYQELVSAILYLVSQGQEEGVVRLHNYKQDVEAHLTAACDEVSHNDPLGAYAVEGIRHSFVRIVTYYEATISISYRRAPEQIAGVIPVTGSGAIRGEVQDTLASFAPEAVLRVNYFNEDAAYIEALVRQAYYDTPAAALGMPQVQVNLYPADGVQRIVEILLTYPDTPEALAQKSAQVLDAAKAIVAPLQKEGLRGDALALALFEGLRARAALNAASHADAGPASTPEVLVSGLADSEGLALSYKLLCDLGGLVCSVAEGTLEGEPRFWTILTTEDGFRHVDPAQPGGFPLTDAQLLEQNFDWNREDYPACGGEEKENA